MLETCKQTEPLQLQSKVDGWSLVRKEAFVLLRCGDRDKLEKPCIAHVRSTGNNSSSTVPDLLWKGCIVFWFWRDQE